MSLARSARTTARSIIVSAILNALTPLTRDGRSTVWRRVLRALLGG